MKSLGLSVPSNVTSMVAMGGFVMAVLAGIGFPEFWPDWLVPAIGAFLGFYSVRDPKSFLIAGLALIGAKFGLRYLPIVGSMGNGIVTHLIALVAPAMLVVSIRSIYHQLKG